MPAHLEQIPETEAHSVGIADSPAAASLRRPVRVCFLIDRLATAGTESQLVALVRNLDRRRVLPYLVLFDGDDALSRSLEPANCPVLRLGLRSLVRPKTLRQAVRLAQFLVREKIDILHVYFTDSTYFGVPVARLVGVPHILRARHSLGYWLTPLHRTLGRIINRLTTATVANCEACRQAMIADEGVAPESVFVLNNGVDFDRFAEVPAVGSTHATEGQRRVGALANLRFVKGLDILLAAAARLVPDHPDLLFAVAGEGDLRSDLQAQAARFGLTDRFQLLGHCEDVPKFLAGLDVAVLSSRAEGMSNAVLEFMAAGRPIVATAVGATPELLDHGRCGLLVPPEDPGRLAEAIDRLLRDPSLAEQLGAAACQRARDCYSRKAMLRRFEAFYCGLASCTGGRIDPR